MVARGVAEGENLSVAIFANEAVVVFRKSLIFHIFYHSYVFASM